MEQFGTQFIFQHGFNSLEIVGEVRAVHIGFLGHTHYGTHFAVLGLVHHHKRLRHLALIERINLLGYFGRQILILKPAASRILVNHQTGVHDGILVL